MRLSPAARDATEIAVFGLPIAAGLHYLSAANDLVASPQDPQKQTAAQSARTLLVFSVGAGAVAWLTVLRKKK